MGRENYLEKAIELTTEIEMKQNALLETAHTTATSEEFLANRKSQIMQTITSETNIDNKPSYSNEAARNAELAVRTGLDEMYSKERERLTALRYKQSRAQNEIAKLQSQTSLYKAFLAGGE